LVGAPLHAQAVVVQTGSFTRLTNATADVILR
jgi:hypothetical protein